MEEYSYENYGVYYSYEDFEKETCDTYEFISKEKGWAYLKTYEDY